MNRSTKFLPVFLLIMFLAVPCPVYAAKAVVVFKKLTCKHFVAQGPEGFYLLEYQGGYDPEESDFIVGTFSSYGFKQVYYPDREQEGKVYVNGFKMSQDSAFQGYFDHCH